MTNGDEDGSDADAVTLLEDDDYDDWYLSDSSDDQYSRHSHGNPDH